MHNAIIIRTMKSLIITIIARDMKVKSNRAHVDKQIFQLEIQSDSDVYRIR